MAKTIGCGLLLLGAVLSLSFLVIELSPRSLRQFIPNVNVDFSGLEEPGDLAGIYYADYGPAREKLVLKKDTNYIQELTAKGEQHPQIATGRWHWYREESGPGYVELSGDYIDLWEKIHRSSDQLNAHPRPEPPAKLNDLWIRSVLGIVHLDHPIDDSHRFSYRREWGSGDDPQVERQFGAASAP